MIQTLTMDMLDVKEMMEKIKNNDKKVFHT
jgi:hypothetical protein